MKQRFIICLVLIWCMQDSMIAYAKHHKSKKQDTVQNSQTQYDTNLLKPPILNEPSNTMTYLTITVILIILGGAVVYFRRRHESDDDSNEIQYENRPTKNEIENEEKLPDIRVDTVNSVIESLEQALGITEDPNVSTGQLKLIQVLLKSLDTYHEENGVITFSGIDGVKDKVSLHQLVVEAVVAPGGFIEFLQNWIVGSFKYEVILYGAKKYSFDELMSDVSHEAFDNDDEEYSPEEKVNKIEPLSTIFPINDLNVYCNGHDLKWSANKSLQKVYKNLVNWSFAKNFVNMFEEDLSESVFTDVFFKEKVFHANGSVNVGNYVYPKDVELAEEKVQSKPNQKLKQKEENQRREREITRIVDDYGFKTPYQNIKNEKPQDSKTIEPIPATTNNKKLGKIYQGFMQAGLPIAVCREGKIYKAFVEEAGLPIGILKNGKVTPGFLEDLLPVAVIENHKLYKGIMKVGLPIGNVSKGKIYLGMLTPSGLAVATYVGDNEDEGLAAAFLLGLLD